MYRILIVDDERNERTGIEKLIRRYQFHLEVVQASNGREALEKFEQNGIDILLTDIKMPLMSGIELIKEVHKRGWDPICIIYSAYGEFVFTQLSIQCWLNASVRYLESEYSSTSQGRFNASSPAIAAISSIRLLVVLTYPADSVFSWSCPLESVN